MQWLQQKMQDRIKVCKRLNQPVELTMKRGAKVLFHPDGKLEISREGSETMRCGVPLQAWLTEVKTFASCAGYSQYDLSFDELTGTARVTPLNQNQGSMFA
jgi:hypothetical protein